MANDSGLGFEDFEIADKDRTTDELGFSDFTEAGSGDEFSEDYFGSTNDDFLIEAQEEEKSFLQKAGTLTRKGVQTASPIAGSIAGGITGAQAGSAIGTLITPGIGTAIGGGLGMLVGGGLGAFTGKTIEENMKNAFEREDEEYLSSGEIFESAKKEAIEDVVFTGLTMGAGKALKPVAKTIGKPIKKRLSKVAKPLLELEGIEKAIVNTDKILLELKNKASGLKGTIDETVEKLMSGQEKKVASEIGKLQEAADFLGKRSAKEARDLLEPLSSATRRSYQELKNQYTNFYKVAGNNSVDIINPLSQLDELVGKFGDDILQSGSSAKLGKINSVIKNKVTNGEVVTFQDGVKLKQAISDVWMDIVTKKGGATAKADIGRPLKSILTGVDNALVDSSPEAAVALKKLNNHYFQVMDIYGDSKRISNMFGKSGVATKREFKETGRSALESFESTAAKRGKQFFGYGSKEATLKALAEGKPGVFQGLKGDALALTSQSYALRQTGVPKLIKLADMMDEKMYGLAKSAVSKKNIEKTVTDLQKATKSFKAGDSQTQGILKQIEKEIAEKQSQQSARKIRKSELLSQTNTKSLLELLFMSNSIAGIAAFSGFPKLGAGVSAAINLAAIGKRSPSASKVALNYISGLEEKIVSTKMSNIILKRALVNILKYTNKLATED